MPKIAPVIAAGTAAAGSLTPLAIASIAASGLGGLLESREQNKARDKRNEATAQIDADERVRQEQIKAQSQQSLNQLVNQHAAEARQPLIAQETQRIQDNIVPASVQASNPLPGQQNASNIIKTDAARQLSDAAAQTRQRLAALAGLSAYGSVDQRLQSARGNEQANQAVRGNLAAGGLAAAQDAKGFHNQEYENFQPSGLGSILSGVGQLGSLAAGQGVGFGSLLKKGTDFSVEG